MTKSAILGPFFRHDTPPTANDADIVMKKPDDGEMVYMHGIVRDATTDKPIAGAKVDIWQCSTNGLYEQQDPDQPEFNLRGNFTTDENGYYGLYCLRPTAYPVPDDGPAGQLLHMLDRHPYRPAHIHVIVCLTRPCVLRLTEYANTPTGRQGPLQRPDDADLRQGKPVPQGRFRLRGKGRTRCGL